MTPMNLVDWTETGKVELKSLSHDKGEEIFRFTYTILSRRNESLIRYNDTIRIRRDHFRCTYLNVAINYERKRNGNISVYGVREIQ